MGALRLPIPRLRRDGADPPHQRQEYNVMTSYSRIPTNSNSHRPGQDTSPPCKPRARRHKLSKIVHMGPASCAVNRARDQSCALTALTRIIVAFIALCPTATVATPAAPSTTATAIERNLSCVASPVAGRKVECGAGDEPAIAKDIDKHRGQYYTSEAVAFQCYSMFVEHFDPARFLLVEPSAGTGAFFKLFPPGSLAFDLDPKYPGVKKADFLTVEVNSHRPVAMIGNPPFGKNSNLAIAFFNRAAIQSDVIAMILPLTFRKASTFRKIDLNFHLLREEVLPANSFFFRSKPYDVPAVFQIWERRRVLRTLAQKQINHADFEFTTAEKADFVIQRVGAHAGRIHRNFDAPSKCHYFIRSNGENRHKVEAIMASIDFASVAANTAGNPSLAKTEIIQLYCEWIEASARKVSEYVEVYS